MRDAGTAGFADRFPTPRKRDGIGGQILPKSPAFLADDLIGGSDTTMNGQRPILFGLPGGCLTRRHRMQSAKCRLQNGRMRKMEIGEWRIEKVKFPKRKATR